MFPRPRSGDHHRMPPFFRSVAFICSGDERRCRLSTSTAARSKTLCFTYRAHRHYLSTPHHRCTGFPIFIGPRAGELQRRGDAARRWQLRAFCHTPQQLMYIPKKHQPPPDKPQSVIVAQNIAYMYVTLFAILFGLGNILMFSSLRDRSRKSVTSADGTGSADGVAASSPRVIVVGGNAAGSTVSAWLTSELQGIADIVCFDAEKLFNYNGAWALAAAGHRNYDILSRDSPNNSLYAQSSAIVPRSVDLVYRNIVHVDPEASCVIDSRGEKHPYSILVMACGAQPDCSTISGLASTDHQGHDTHSGRIRILAHESGAKNNIKWLYDTLSVATNPTSIRDNLWSTGFGNLLIVRVPSATSPNVVAERANRSIVSRLFSSRGTNEAKLANAQMCENESVHEGDYEFSPVPVDAYTRGYEGTFIGLVNTIWKYLRHFGRSHVALIAMTEDHAPAAGLGTDVNEAVLTHWWDRGVDFRPGKALRRIDKEAHTAYFTDVTTGKEEAIPYTTLVLDLPLAAPPVIHKSGLDSPGTAGFVAVNRQTLQHSKYSNIFALGDCAALPQPKSYSAVTAQAPVVAHNVRQVLEGRKPNAKYNGYTSGHIPMTTWRALWFENEIAEKSLNSDCAKANVNIYNLNRYLLGPAVHAAGYAPEGVFGWAGLRGFCYGAWTQILAQELAHWRLWLKGQWFPLHPWCVPMFDDDEEFVGKQAQQESQPVL